MKKEWLVKLMLWTLKTHLYWEVFLFNEPNQHIYIIFLNRVVLVSRLDSELKIQRTDVAEGHGDQGDWGNLGNMFQVINLLVNLLEKGP